MRTKTLIVKPSWCEQAEFYLKQLDRLIDQDTFWLCERIKAITILKDWKRASFIETTYLTPIERKIRELARRMVQL